MSSTFHPPFIILKICSQRNWHKNYNGVTINTEKEFIVLFSREDLDYGYAGRVAWTDHCVWIWDFLKVRPLQPVTFCLIRFSHAKQNYIIVLKIVVVLAIHITTVSNLVFFFTIYMGTSHTVAFLFTGSGSKLYDFNSNVGIWWYY